MDSTFRSGLILIAGIVLLIASAIASALSVDSSAIASLLLVVGLLLSSWALYKLRNDIRLLFSASRRELLLSTVGVLGVLIAIAWVSALYPKRIDLTATQEYSLAPETVQMVKTIDRPVHITFFHDRGMRETVELYELFAAQNAKITVEFFDPTLNPAQAKLRGVQFAGTALFESEGRKLTVNGPTETDIANGLLRVTQTKQQLACFLEGHGEPNPFSLESHDHTEGAGHSHGIETKVVQHEQHGMAKARNALEALNYLVEKVSLMQANTDLARCSVLIVAGPQTPLLEPEIKAIDAFLDNGGKAMFMIDPFIKTGLDPVIAKFGIVMEDDMVIDPASHFWADPSTPAVSDYNPHEITSKLPQTFFPGARTLSPTKLPVPGVSVRQLVNTSKKSFSNLDRSKVEFVEGKNRSGPLTIMATARINPQTVESAETVMRRLRGEQVDEAKPITNRKEARIVVVGDSDFATNSFYHLVGNGTLFMNAVNFLAARDNLIGLKPRTYDLPLVIMTNTQMKGTFVLSIILIPLLMAALGVAVWWRRK